MAEKINLTDTEKELYEKLRELFLQTQQYYKLHPYGDSSNKDDQIERNEKMAEKAHKLHISLKKRELEPKHHKYMYENRGVPPENLEFYNHLHPIEDLIKFIEDPDANNDPEDSTLNEKFDFRIYTRRWGHYDNYTLIRTEGGWKITGIGTFDNTDADKTGKPAIFKAFEHDMISYPYNVDKMLEWIWNKASNGEDKETIKKAVSDLAEWISICEKSTPRGIFEDLL